MVKVKPKNVFAFRHIKTCCLGVSLHSTNHSGEKLSAVIEYINQNFNNLLIDLSDTLYSHHYMSLGLSRTEAFFKAQLEGDRWIEENQAILDKINIPYKIVRWENWLKHEDFQSLYDNFYDLFVTNDVFHEAVMVDIRNYYKRRYNKDVDGMHHRFLKSSVAYLIEEIACHTLLAREYTDIVNVYPGKQLECFRVVREGKVKDAPSGLENFGHIRLCLYETDITPLAA